MAPTLPFDRTARYGAAIVCMIFGVYLGTATDFSAIVQSATYAGTIHTDVPLLNVVQFILVLAAMLTAVVLLPTSGWRRLAAFTLVCVVLFLWATFGLQRGAGNLIHPVAFWRFVLDQGFIMLVAAIGGWVIARGRHPLSWIVVILAVIPAILTPIMMDNSFPTGALALVSQAAVAVGGLGAVWLAVWLDRMWARREKGADAAASTPSLDDDQSSSVR